MTYTIKINGKVARDEQGKKLEGISADRTKRELTAMGDLDAQRARVIREDGAKMEIAWTGSGVSLSGAAPKASASLTREQLYRRYRKVEKELIAADCDQEGRPQVPSDPDDRLAWMTYAQ